MKKTIHLADCHQIIIDALQVIIREIDNLEVVCTSTNYDDLMINLHQYPTDIIVIDTRMPKIEGAVEIIDFILSVNPSCDIFVLSYLNRLHTIKDLFKHGIKGYLDKTQGFSLLEMGLLKIKQGEVFMGEQLQKEIVGSFCGNIYPEKKKLKLYNCIEPLTEREIDVLKLICSEMNSKEISEQLFISEHTVNTHRKHLLRKLNVKKSIGLVKYALENQII